MLIDVKGKDIAVVRHRRGIGVCPLRHDFLSALSYKVISERVDFVNAVPK